MIIPSHLELGRALLPAMLKAARLELGYFRSGIDVARKADASPVTIADQEAEAIILEALARVAPDVPVIAEEQYSAGIIPDVDGTLFVMCLTAHGRSVRGDVDFTINVALIVDRVPVFGMILLPANGEFYVTKGPTAAGYAILDVTVDVGFDYSQLTVVLGGAPSGMTGCIAFKFPPVHETGAGAYQQADCWACRAVVFIEVLPGGRGQS